VSTGNWPVSRHWRGRIPFLIRLRDCRSGRLPAPDSFPGLISERFSAPPSGWVEQCLSDGTGLVLFDGADEVPNVRRNDVGDEILAFVRRYPKGSVYVS
jgi:hypothetical protein